MCEVVSYFVSLWIFVKIFKVHFYEFWYCTSFVTALIWWNLILMTCNEQITPKKDYTQLHYSVHRVLSYITDNISFPTVRNFRRANMVRASENSHWALGAASYGSYYAMRPHIPLWTAGATEHRTVWQSVLEDWRRTLACCRRSRLLADHGRRCEPDW